MKDQRLIHRNGIQTTIFEHKAVLRERGGNPGLIVAHFERQKQKGLRERFAAAKKPVASFGKQGDNVSIEVLTGAINDLTEKGDGQICQGWPQRLDQVRFADAADAFQATDSTTRQRVTHEQAPFPCVHVRSLAAQAFEHTHRTTRWPLPGAPPRTRDSKRVEEERLAVPQTRLPPQGQNAPGARSRRPPDRERATHNSRGSEIPDGAVLLPILRDPTR